MINNLNNITDAHCIKTMQHSTVHLKQQSSQRHLLNQKQDINIFSQHTWTTYKYLCINNKQCKHFSVRP